jgi:hypothetical protein
MFRKMGVFLIAAVVGAAQEEPNPSGRIALSVPAGAPLRIYLTKRLS